MTTRTSSIKTSTTTILAKKTKPETEIKKTDSFTAKTN